MKRIGVVVVVVLLAATSAFALPASSQTPVVTDGRTIPVYAVDFLSDIVGYKIGDDCSIPLDVFRFIVTDQQVVVRDEHDEIIALLDLEGTIDKTSDGTWKCEIDIEIPVRDAAFYTVYLGDERIVSYAASDFPIDTFDSVMITF